MKIGYARVSKPDTQDTTVQIDALKTAGAEKIFQEAASGGRWDRPQLHKTLEQLHPGDVLMLWKLDRLLRLLKDLRVLLETVERAQTGFYSPSEAIDTTTPAGRVMMQMVDRFAAFERAMIRERTRNGLEAARRQGRVGGRKPKLTAAQKEEIVTRITVGQWSSSDAARLFAVHPSRISRVMAKH